MPSISCPECGKELLPQPDMRGMRRSLCPTCSREIFRPSKIDVKIVCPECDTDPDTSESR